MLSFCPALEATRPLLDLRASSRACQADPPPLQPASPGPGHPRGFQHRVRAKSPACYSVPVVLRPYVWCVLPNRMAGTPFTGRFLAEAEIRCCRSYWANSSWIEMHSPLSCSVDYRFLPLFQGLELPPSGWRKKTLSDVGLKVPSTPCPRVGICLTCTQELHWDQEGVKKSYVLLL